MKKVLIVIIIILIVLIFAVGFMTYSVITKEKESMSAEQFKNFMEEKEYVIYDATSQYNEYEYIEKVYIATTIDNEYKIEYYVLSDNESAKYFYSINKNIFENSKSTSVVETNNTISNYSKYTLNSNDKYMVISRINNTAIYVNANEEYKNVIKDLLKEINY